MTSVDLDEELPDPDPEPDGDKDYENHTDGGDSIAERVRAAVEQFLDGIPMGKAAILVAAGLALGFPAGRMTTPETLPAAPAAAAIVAAPTTPAQAPPDGPAKVWVPSSSDSGSVSPTITPPPTTVDVPETYPATDGVVAGYSTKMPREYIKTHCLNRRTALGAAAPDVAPDPCLRKWELEPSFSQFSWWRPLIPDPEQTIVPKNRR